MTQRGELTIQPRSRSGGAGRRRKDRRLRTWVQVQTDAETYVGCLLSPGGRAGLDEVLNDGRAYLALRDATLSGSDATEEFVALHKGVIRSIVVVEPPSPEVPSSVGTVSGSSGEPSDETTVLAADAMLHCVRASIGPVRRR